MNPTTKSEDSNFPNGSEGNATRSSPQEGGTSAENHGPASLAQTLYDEIVGFIFGKEGAEVPETSTGTGLQTTNETSSSSLTNSQFPLQFETSLPEAQAELIEEGDVWYESTHYNTEGVPGERQPSQPEAQAELIEEGGASYESTHYNTEGISGKRQPTQPDSTPETPNTEGISGKRQPTQPDSTPETPNTEGISGKRQPTQPDSTPETLKSPSKRRLWIGVGIAAVVATALAIVLSLTLPKSSSGGSYAPFQSTTAELQRAVDDYLAGGERKALATSTYGTNIGSWNVSAITNFDQLFSANRNPAASTFNEPLLLWDVSKATSMREMFLNAAQFDQPLKAWNVSSVVDMTRILSGATSFRQDLCVWRSLLPMSCNLTDSMQGSSCAVKSDPVLDDPSEASFCSYCSAISKAIQDRTELLAAVDAYLADSSNTTDVASIYGHPIGTWQVSRVTDFSELFSPLRNVLSEYFNEDISKWDTSAARTFHGMFRGGFIGTDYLRSSFNMPLNDWSTGSVIDMSFMFTDTLVFDQSLAQWDTAKVTTFSSAFRGAVAFNQPLNDWITSSATNMSSMFQFAYKFNQRLDLWGVGNVSDMEFMFLGSSAFNNGAADESRPLLWYTSKVVNMREMFAMANVYNQPMDHWDVSSATDMGGMFSNATVFNRPLCSWLSQLSPQTDVSGMFYGTACLNESSPVLSTNPPTGPMCTPC